MVKWKEDSGLVAVLVLIAVSVISANVPIEYADTLSDIVPFADDPSRLPENVIPVHYDLSLTAMTQSIFTGSRNYTGNVKIQIKIVTNTNLITLHNRNLNVTSVTLTGIGGGSSITTTHSYGAYDFLTIDTGSTILSQGQEYLLDLDFFGNMRTDNGGFYRSSYRVQGETVPRYLGATQFQSTSARSAFPCFDEPALKATFTTSITHGKEYFAISNTEGMSTENADGTITTAFKKSPIMSSYLNAWVVSDFASRSLDNGPQATRHSVFARLEDVDKVQESLEHSYVFLKQLEDYCGYKYELPKMYSAAIPDFAAGAMENWGLILYKEYFLINDKNSHPRDVFDMWRVTAHELAHQFFGNLVTYDWWDKIWMNEGMATFFEYYLVELTYPQARMRDHFNVRKTQNAFRRDSLLSTAPMTDPNMRQPNEINYDKGGAVVRMFQHAIGDDLYRAALNRYLLDNHHKPVATHHFLAAFETVLAQAGVNNFNFSNAFVSWELQAGYPVIDVRYDYPTESFYITQKRYLQSSEEPIPNDPSSWYIPLSYTTSNSPNFEDTKFTDYFVNNQPFKSIPVEGINGNQWYLFNIQQMGFYRVNYDRGNWYKMILLLNSPNYKSIHVNNRAQLVDDALTMAFDGYLGYDIAFGIMSYLSQETDYIPWYPAVMNFDKLDYILKGTPLHAPFRRFVRLMVRRIHVSYGLKNLPTDGVFEQFARELGIDWTCRMGDQRCLDYAYAQIQTPEDIPKPLDITFMCNGLKGGNREREFVNLFNRFRSSSDQADRMRIIDGITCATNTTLLVDLLQSTLGSEIFYRSHERSRIYSNMWTRSSSGLEAMMQFIVQLYSDIRSVNGNVFDGWFTTASRRVSSAEDEQLIINTMNQLQAEGRGISQSARDQVMANIKFNKDWVASERYQELSTFVNSHLSNIDIFEKQLRVPKISEPLNYKIHLDVRGAHTGQLPYTGEVTIDIAIKQTTNKIFIHSKNQVINEIQVHDKAGAEIQVLDYSLQTAADSLTIYFMNDISVGTQINVNIKYSTRLLTTSTGFYRTTYTQNGTLTYLAATQFQPTSARYAFPHYDEPGYKTPFDLSITHDASYTAIANTFGYTVPNGDGTVTTTFERTPIMSSYLLAFVVSAFSNITNELTREPRDTLHRIWTKPDSISKAQLALDSSVKVLKALESYCYFDYALPKVDSAAIPNKNSAMENWGMVTYWETAMIYEENDEDIPHNLRFSGVRVIGHELAHQFFGDAVTCEWWDQIWLNEGFATLMQYVVVDQFQPTWRMYDFMATFTMHNTAFISDSRDTTRAMTSDVLTLSEISNSFDNIAYSKAGCVLRMFQNALGENIFRRSLEHYLKTNNYQPVISQNLVDSIETIMDRYNLNTFDFDKTFRSWENQKGYPLITVHYDIPSQSFHVTQQRFFEFKKAQSNDTSSWSIPLNYATSSSPNFATTAITDWFESGQSAKAIYAPAFTTSQWYVFNKQQTGYYRVHYGDNNWRSLSYALNSPNYQTIHVMNRAQLIDDSFALAIGGYVNYDIAFDIVKYLNREDDFFPWYTCYRYLNSMYSIFGNKNPTIRKFFKHLSEKFYSKYKLPTNGVVPFDDLVDRYGRNYAASLACNAGNEECLKNAFTLVHLFVDHDRKIPNGLELFYCHGLRGVGKVDEFVGVWRIMSLTADATFKNTLINALGCTDDPQLQWDYLDSTLGSNGNNVNYTQNNRRDVFGAVVANSLTSLPVVLDFLKAKESEVLAAQGRTLDQVLTVVANSIKNEEDQMLFHSFLLTRTSLSATYFLSISRIVGNNLAAQTAARYSTSLKEMERVIEEWENEDGDEAFAWVLPRTSVPDYYRLHLDVRNIHTGTRAFAGEVSIDLTVTQSTNRIMMHSRNQEILSVTAINRGTNAAVNIVSRRMTPNVDTMLLFFDRSINAGTRLTVTIKYQASLVTSSTGFYQTTYTVDNILKYAAATQFEEVGARYAFPCYDEPEYKAVFEVKITHDKSVGAWANTMETVVDNGDGTVTSNFLPSPPMSTYLNAFLVGDFGYIDNAATKAANDTYMRIIVRKDSLTKSPYALENSEKALKALESYVNFDYEITKMDSAGVPNKGGAMENWGLLKYSEGAMIYSEDINDTPHTRIFSGVRVISHEVAHQFFGNVVTCKWWNYIWLNEGFAQLLQYTLTDIYQPGWRMKDFHNAFAIINNAFRVDARNTTRAMSPQPIAITPDDFGRYFDTIAYDKSASVIRTFEHAVGESNFVEALNLYLNVNRNKPVVSQDLMDAFTTTLRKNNFNAFDFDRAFRTWEVQKGYPLLNVRYDEASRSFVLTQSRFFEQKTYGIGDQSSWYIPLNFYTATFGNFDDTSSSHYFQDGQPSTAIPISGFTLDQWVVFNKQQRGYFRVNYDDNIWRALSMALSSENYKKIHVMNRAQLIDDSFTLVTAGYLEDFQTAYDILKYLITEDDFFPWYTANRYLAPLINVFGFKDPTLIKFIQKLSEKYYKKYKLDSSNKVPVDILPERYGRALAYQLACNALDAQCLRDTWVLVHIYVNDNTAKIPAGLESVYCSGLRGPGKQDDLVALWRQMSLTSDTTLKSTFISALGCSDNEAFLKDYLESSLGANGNNVNYTSAQRRSVFSSVLQSHSGLPVIIDFLTKFEANIISSYGQTLYTTLNTVAATIKNREDQALFSDYLSSLTGLSGTQYQALSKRVTDNLALQKTADNARQMELIKGILDEWEFGILDGHQWRLPKTSKPEYYRVHLDVRNIHTGDKAYNGEVSIDISMLQTTNRILFHSKSQVINEVKAFERGSSTEIKIRGYRLFPSADTILIFFENVLSAGARITIRIKYSTNLLTDAFGFYQTNYTMGGDVRFVGATQFEPARARYALPCYDEPEYKTPYELKITHDASVKAHANTMETKTTNMDGTITSSFEPTPTMSSYLLAFAVSDFEYIDNSATMAQRNETYQRIIIRSDGLTKASYALDNSIKTLEALENYVNYKYEINKLDSIGVPNKGGAMENWGFITYRENAMIYEENVDDISHTQKFSGVRVIAHEIAHQFFGNAVTCSWWSYIWLNEGFAELLQYTLVNTFYPEWRMQHFMNIFTMQLYAFATDAKVSTRAMTTDAETPTEISALFDDIAYDKSASVLRMFQHAVGERLFRDSLNLYLTLNDHKPAVSQQLIDSFTTTLRLERFQDFDFEYAFRTWELQKGFPLVNVWYSTLSSSYWLSQQRFFEKMSYGVNDTSKWYIPINYATSDNPNFDDTSITDYFVDSESNLQIPSSQSTWYVFNKQQLSYYRVNYDTANWNALKTVLNSNNFNAIHVMNRVQLIDDSFALANAGYHADYNLAFGIMNYLERETDFFPFYPAYRYLSNLLNIFGPTNRYLRTFVLDISRAFYNKYKLPADDKMPLEIVPERYGRHYATNLACNSGNLDCLQDAFSLVYLYAHFDQKIPNGMELLYCAGFRGDGKKDEFVEVWKKMQATTDANFKLTLINGLGCTDNPTLITDFLHSSLGDGNSVSYTAAQRRAVFTSVLQSHTGLPVITSFIKEFSSYMVSRYGWNLQQILTQVANTIKTEQDQIFFINFMLSLDNLSGDALRAVSQITYENLAKQKLPQNVAQMEALMLINPDIVDPRDNFTIQPTFTAPSNTPSLTTTTLSSTLPLTTTTSTTTSTSTSSLSSSSSSSSSSSTSTTTEQPSSSSSSSTEEPSSSSSSTTEASTTEDPVPLSASSLTIKLPILIVTLIFSVIFKYIKA